MRPVYLPAGTTASSLSNDCILDYHLDPANIMLTVELYGNTGGGASYTVQYSPDDPYATYAVSYDVNGNWYNHPTLVNLAADGVDQLSVPARAVRLSTNTPGTDGTNSPRLVVIQAGGIS